ncbi:uncharacterized protein LOC127471903 isoform X1 [Manacus candei]|uniref:uncharacterized protein LOC127471903 isoform X1 n=1 Tax=Manacus candei TaxID=415023 RepID=UPI002226CCA4|nr:uncharacterized protein LOC127471903 isoform X1 [Manacus candei]
MPNSPKPLLGRDLLEKLEAEIKFTKGGDIKVIIPDTKYVEAAAFFIQEKHGEIPAEVENAVIPLVWASEYPGKSKQAEPVSIALRPGAAPVRQKQYPLKLESRKGLAPIIEKFLKFGLLVECESRFNTPILPVRKADGKSYRLVQDLRAINRITEDIYPVVANPYTLLTTLTEDLGWFTVLDLKDAFFCIPVHKDSQEIFAFEWENPETGRKTQLTWRVLPQGFKNSPTLFGNQLAKELEDWRRQQQEGVVLQYVDDILIAAKNRDQCIELTLDSVSQGWPGCLRAVAATVILIEEARKLTLGQHITVYVPHAVQAVLEQKGGHWLSPSRMLKYQVVLLEQDDVTLKTTSIVNPAMFLSSALTDSVPEHDCLQTIEETYSSRPDLKDVPLENADWELYTDGSSFMRDGKHFTGYAVTTRDEVIEAKALSADVSSQKAELIALTRALELSEGKKKLQKVIELSRPIGLDTPAHPFQPGDWIYVKWWNSDPLRARWRGPYQVLLTSLTSVKVAGREPWFHYSRVKKASAPGTTNQTEPDTDNEDVE